MRNVYDFGKGKKNPYAKHLNGTVENVAQPEEAVTSKSENVAMVLESEDDATKETAYLMSALGVHEELLKAKDSDPSEYVDYDPNEEW